MTIMISKLAHRLVPLVALATLLAAMGGTWKAASAAPLAQALAPPVAATAAHAGKRAHHELTGKLNLNTATEDQLMLLPTIGPAKAERIVAWRKKNGAFRRIADLRRVKGIGYKSFRRLEPYLDVQGATTLSAQ
jgi:competence protein ComEA